jgi:ATP-binding cassette subfamily C protein CydCD
MTLHRGFTALLADVRVVGTRALLIRGVWFAALTLVQRALGPVLAWVLVGRDASGLRLKLAVAFALSLVFAAHTLAQRSFTALAQGELFDRTATSILRGDVLRANLLPDEDARSQLTQAISESSQWLAQTVPSMAADLVACVVLGAAVLWTEPVRLAALAVLATLAAVGALLLSRRFVDRAVAHAWTLQGRVYGVFADILEGRLDLVASGLGDAALRDLQALTSSWGAAGVNVATSTALAGRLPALAIAVFVAVVVVVMADPHGSGGVSLADAAFFASITPAFAGVAQGLHAAARGERWTRVVARVLRAGAAYPLDAPGTASAPALPALAALPALPALPAAVAFDRVSFAYSSGASGDRSEDALNALTLTWGGRSVLALAGSNGSGKSTCLRLLLALAQPSAGAIHVGRTDLAAVDPDEWRRRIAFLPQRPYLPPRTDVRRALRWLAPDADDARMRVELDRVGILAALDRAARAGAGSRDPLEVRVDTLSVGQRQRVALARLLCRDADLVVLDEPDANLDRDGIALVARLVRELAATRMVVFAAHTAELLDVADEVVTLDAGRVVSRQPAVRAS